MPGPTAQAEIDRLIEKIVAQLEKAHAQRRANYFLVRGAGGAAALIGRVDLVARLHAIISGLTLEYVLGGAITNIEPRTVDKSRILTLPSAEEAARDHPVCSRVYIMAQMKSREEPHLRLCVNGDIEGATKAARSELALEEIGCTLAAMGEFDRAIAFVEAHPAHGRPASQAPFVIVLEKCRRQLPGFLDAIRKTGFEDFESLNVIYALLGASRGSDIPIPIGNLCNARKLLR